MRRMAACQRSCRKTGSSASCCPGSQADSDDAPLGICIVSSAGHLLYFDAVYVFGIQTADISQEIVARKTDFSVVYKQFGASLSVDGEVFVADDHMGSLPEQFFTVFVIVSSYAHDDFISLAEPFA